MRLNSLFISLAVQLSALTAAAGDQLTVNPTVYSSAAEQLQAAVDLRSRIAAAETDEARMFAVANASASAWVVQSRWPNDDEAVFASHILLADIFRDGNWTRNAADALEAGRSVAAKLGREAMIDVRLAEVRHLLNDHAGANAAAAASVKASSLARLNADDALNVLQAAGRIYAALGKHASAADCYTRAAKRAPTTMRQTVLYVYAGQQHRKLGDRAAANEAAALARNALRETRNNAEVKGDGAFDMLDTLENQILVLEKD